MEISLEKLRGEVRPASTKAPKLTSTVSRIEDILSSIHSSIFRINDLNANISHDARYDETSPESEPPMPDKLTIFERISSIERSLSLIDIRLASMKNKLEDYI